MDSYDQAVGVGVILRKDHSCDRKAWISCITGDTEPTCGIIPSGTADRIHEHLVPLVQDLVLGIRIGNEGIAPSPATVLDLVERFHHKPFSLVLEAVCDLGPDAEYLVLDLLVGRRIVIDRLNVQPVTLVMMGIHYGNQASLFSISDNLLDSGQPFVIKAVSRGFTYMASPGNTDTDSLESCSLQAVKSGLGTFVVAPDRLSCHSIADSVHLVAHVPSRGHGIEHHRRCDS